LALELRGGEVLLRPLWPEELDVLDMSHEGVVEERRSDPSARERLRRRIAHSGRFFDGRLDLAIDVDGELVGAIDARRPEGALPPGVFGLGISLFAAASRGRGYGTEAVRLLTSHLFSAGAAERVQGSTDVANVPMRRVFERVGFVEEGVLRCFMPASGGRADYVLYAVTRAEWLARDRPAPRRPRLA
jgi:RimJ/RimL family protein N-acetyltransferase